MKSAILLLVAVLGVAGCNDLTEPLPWIGDTYTYVSTSGKFPSHNRTGTIRIVDDDRLSARFDGTYSFLDGNGETVTGTLTGAFITPDSIWFRFVDDRLEYHEAKLVGDGGSGEIFFLTTAYRSSGTRFTLQR